MASALPKRDSMEAGVGIPLSTKSSSPRPDTDQPKQRASLTSLPPSIRNTIYKYALDTELVNTGLSNVSYTQSLDSATGMLQFKASRSPFPVETGLFYVSKLIGTEALHFFYSSNLFVRLSLFTSDARHAKTMLIDSGLLFAAPPVSMLETSTHHALDVDLIEKNSEKKRATIMFPAQYLPRLINFLRSAGEVTKTWGNTRTLHLAIVNSYSFPTSRLQGDLLEPFRVLKGFSSVTIAPAHTLPHYTSGLSSSITTKTFDASHWIETVTELADLSDAARATTTAGAADHALSAEYAQAVVVALTYGFLTSAEEIHGPAHAEETFKAIQRLRWRVELGLGIALSLQHKSLDSHKDWLTDDAVPALQRKAAARDLLLAETSISRALSLATDSPSPAENPWYLSLPVELIPPNKPGWFEEQERAQTWYALGVVHTSLGEYLFAAGAFERALGMWGAGEGVEKVEAAFEKARIGIESDREGMFKGRVQPGSGLRRAARVAKMSVDE
ncbi:uncharacterized protein M421DRAFT_273736 [Didymella exigua CBS 183.55]|uniref:F-box domain-containing protein n=1 Tax=Didymella exigua CBS 183.55 TaxID=1150837 RepID=A0A6A5RAT3_9PLEO|nr:uncharacterized protein M421DRAFT_273736 [Didymella exigua CBS 183.55]KAF1924653.1 hypothetical protein M421DRAFT_273736 [Didymella exigua CBS 183.55]